MNNELENERLLELLADQTLFGLSKEESTELEGLQTEFPEYIEDNSFEKAALAISLTNLRTDTEMPHNLQARILVDADKYFDSEEVVAKVSEGQTKRKMASPSITTSDTVFETAGLSSGGSSWTQWLGWGVAALACIALVANIWITRIDSGNEVVKNPETTETPKKEPTLLEKKQQFLASAKDVIKTAWASPDTTNKELKGEITWSNAKQEGYMTFRGLPANDREKEAYQLWIFDEAQDEKTPVDGGVFDVDKNGEVIIPIDAKINVKNPKLFAVTVEKPGGVVVSKREKIVALAKVEA